MGRWLTSALAFLHELSGASTSAAWTKETVSRWMISQQDPSVVRPSLGPCRVMEPPNRGSRQLDVAGQEEAGKGAQVGRYSIASLSDWSGCVF